MFDLIEESPEKGSERRFNPPRSLSPDPDDAGEGTIRGIKNLGIRALSFIAGQILETLGMSACGRSVKVIGAGVAGLTVAAELVERGFNVCLYDKGDIIGTHSCSWFAGGMLAPWCELESAEEPVARLGLEAADWWEKRIGPIERKGSLVLAQPRDTADLNRFSRRTKNFIWADQDKVASLEPDLAGRFKKALFFAEEAHLNPREALTSLSHYLKEKGVAFHLGTDGFTASKTEITVDARGYSAHDKLRDLRGVKGEMLILKSDEINLSRPIRLLHPRIPLYIVPRANGHFMVGATMIESGERGRVTARSMIELLSSAYTLHPAFGEAEVVEIGSDVRPAFPDNLPKVIQQDGIFYINGLYRHGFLLSPAMATIAANAIEKGVASEFYDNQDQKDEAHEAYDQRARA